MRPEAREARARGVVFDVGHGFRMCSLDVIRRCLDQGFPPDTVSTDIYRVSAVRPDVTLPAILSKLMAAGLSLPEAIRTVTERPARVLGLEGRLGTLGEGAEADVAVFRLEEEERVFRGIPESVLEAEGRDRRAEEEVVGRQWLEPVHLIVGGRPMATTATPVAGRGGAR